MEKGGAWNTEGEKIGLFVMFVMFVLFVLFRRIYQLIFFTLKVESPLRV